MRKKSVYLDKFTESLISISNYRDALTDDNDRNYEKMVNSIRNIIKGELTEKQRSCIMLYYGERIKMKDIANQLGMGISSVSRHIKKAKERLKKTMGYYF